MTDQATAPSAEESLAMLAAAQKALAGHRLQPLRAVLARVEAAGLPGLAAELRAVLPLMAGDPMQGPLTQYAVVLEQFANHVSTAIANAEKAGA